MAFLDTSFRRSLRDVAARPRVARESAIVVAVGALAAEPLRPAGAVLLLVGALGGLPTAGLSALRAYRQPPA